MLVDSGPGQMAGWTPESTCETELDGSRRRQGMQRISGTSLNVAFWATATVLSGAAQEFQREADTIPVFIDGESVLQSLAGGTQWRALSSGTSTETEISTSS